MVIPARFAATRFPGKPLAPLKGLPVIQHVYERSLRSQLASDVFVATDNERIFEKVLAFGGKAVMTSHEHPSGTDRIAEVAASLACDIIVNVQGDEPLIRPEMIDDVISLLQEGDADIGTLAKGIQSRREVFDPNVVKVVFGEEGRAFYFSRAPIPFHRDLFTGHPHETDTKGLFMFKHIGIYSYRRDILLRLAQIKPSRLELIEKLEQLRALENGFVIKVGETDFETLGVDTPEDLERIEQCLNSSS
ncbi:MAG: 3-deoxy-manno-octulosonate cytidylyltransferase [Nitrospiraceae bacterium]|nr:3-deoxy-manno-octulosonate cytidylyltransferase [Nitrospiraceae bacterium]